MTEVHVKKIAADAKLPAYARNGDAGADLYSNETISFLPGERKAVSTGIAMAVPKGHTGIIKDRGGVALNHGLHCLAGVFDENYRGEWKIVMVNTGNQSVTLEKHERICQVLFLPVTIAAFIETRELDETNRGHGRFGSSGKN